MITGIIFSIIVSILFSAYAIPRKFSQQNVILYTMFVGLAYMVGSIVWCAIIWSFDIYEKENLLSRWHLFSILRGVVWTIGTVFYNVAIDKIGLSRFNQWKNLQGPIGSVLMLAILSDVIETKIIFVILGMITMFVSAVLFTIGKDDKKSTLTGIISAILAACCFGFTAFIQKLLTAKGFVFSQLLYHSVFVVLSAIIIYLIQTRKPQEIFCINKKTWLPIISGFMFLIATILGGLAYTMIAGSVSWSIVQLNAAWTILIGIFIFKEINFKKHRVRIMSGFAFALIAIIFLFFAL